MVGGRRGTSTSAWTDPAGHAGQCLAGGPGAAAAADLCRDQRSKAHLLNAPVGVASGQADSILQQSRLIKFAKLEPSRPMQSLGKRPMRLIESRVWRLAVSGQGGC